MHDWGRLRAAGRGKTDNTARRTGAEKEPSGILTGRTLVHFREGGCYIDTSEEIRRHFASYWEVGRGLIHWRGMEQFEKEKRSSLSDA